MEVIVGAIQVGRHHGDIVGTVLQVVALAHLQTGNLGDGIFLVGVLQRRREQAVLLHRLRGILGIDAGRAQEEQTLHTVTIGLADDVALHEHVLHDEVGSIERVGHDATHEGCRQNDGLGALLVEEASHGQLVGEVKLAVATPNKVGITTLQEIVPDGRANKSPMAGHIDFRIHSDYSRAGEILDDSAILIHRFAISETSCAPSSYRA